jgi:predicted RNA-binding protein YlxR (DUF448 family)
MGGSPKKLTQPAERHRRCVGCGLERPKSELLRIARNSEGCVSVDVSGRVQGRGAYLCANAECVRKAMKKNSLSRALKHPVDRELYNMIVALCAHPDENGAR